MNRGKTRTVMVSGASIDLCAAGWEWARVACGWPLVVLAVLLFFLSLFDVSDGVERLVTWMTAFAFRIFP
ncbi:MAG: hypothetical protein AAB152_02915 [Candidatus Coatesbacteria bacterium]